MVYKRAIRKRYGVKRFSGVRRRNMPVSVPVLRSFVSTRVPRLMNRQTHYFKRIGATIPLSFVFDATNNRMQCLTKTVLDANASPIVGWYGNSTVQVAPISLTNGNIIPCGTGTLQQTASGTGVGNTSSLGFTATFNLGQAVEHTDFTTLFDRYKILGVSVKIMYHHNSASVINPSMFPTLYYCYDGDDGSVVTSKLDIQRQEGCKVQVLRGSHKFYCKPRIELSPSTSTSGSTQVLTERAKWLNCVDAKVNHYAMKFFIDNITNLSGSVQGIEIQPYFYLALKDTQ